MGLFSVSVLDSTRMRMVSGIGSGRHAHAHAARSSLASALGSVHGFHGRRISARNTERESALYGRDHRQYGPHHGRVAAQPGDEGPTTSSTTEQTQEEQPLWVRREEAKARSEEENKGKLPFGAYLLFSCIVAIAAIASIFEYTYQNPIFGVVPPDSFFYKPILGIFVFTGIPVSGYLFYLAIKSANELSQQMDDMDNL